MRCIDVVLIDSDAAPQHTLIFLTNSDDRLLLLRKII